MEGMQFVPGKGYVFVPDSSPTQIPTNPNPAATSSPTPESLKPYAQPVLSDIEKPSPPAPPRQTVDVDRNRGIDIDDIAEPMKDAQGNVTGYRIRGQVGYDEANRPTVKSLRGSSNDVQIWKPKEGYSVFGTSDKIIEFAKKHGTDLPRKGLADLLGDKGELVIPVNRSGVSGVADAAKAAKAVGKTALKMVPFIGTAASLAAMGQRAQAGDYVGAGLEAASEVADYIPGVGTAASLGIQSVLADRDMSDEERKESEQRAARQALRSMNVHSPRY